jgi:hypothetical protein
LEETPPARPEPPAPARRSRTGKIARLPLALRTQLNRRLQNGEPGKVLAEWLNGNPTVQAIIATEFDGRPINEGNLSQWRNGGYKDWEKAEATREAVVGFVEEIMGLDKTAQEGLANCLAVYLAAQTALELKRLESVPAGAEKEKTWRELTNRVVALRQGGILEVGRR